MRRLFQAAAVFVLTLLPYCAAFGQTPVINGVLNGSGNYVPNGTCSTCVPLPVDATTLPSTVTQVFAPATGTTAAVVSTLPAVSAKTNFICGYSIDSGATAAAFATATVTGLLGGTSTNYMQVGALPAATNFKQIFTPCLPASAVNTAIVVTSGAAGVGGFTAVNAWGYVK